jgi:hypothetical protein
MNKTNISDSIYIKKRPWAFSQAQLTAGLRRHTGDPSLTIDDFYQRDITQRLPATGRLRGITVHTNGTTGKDIHQMVLKENHGKTRVGNAGAGLREVSIYQILRDQIPVRMPPIFAADPNGNWLLLQHLSPGKRPSKWLETDYLLAIDQLITLHDRFWNLGNDLAIYPWLGRPLGVDFAIHLQSTKNGLNNLVEKNPPSMLSEDLELHQLISHLISNGEVIVSHLNNIPQTLLHGDFWPGNIHIQKDSTLTVYDWEDTAVGPGILDLLYLIQASRWWFNDIPISNEDISNYYRKRIRDLTGFNWSDDQWETDWDFALMWSFLSQWVDLLSNIPNPILISQLPQLEGIWLQPIRKAAIRRLNYHSSHEN